MNEPARNVGPTNRAWWTSKRVICFALLAAVTLYVLAQPKLEQWTGLDLPDLVERDQPAANADPEGNGQPFRIDPEALKGADTGDGAAAAKESGFQLKEISRDSYESPAGLVYTMGPRREHRIEHVMRHARNDKNRDGPHGVFDADTQTEVLSLLDEAWQRVQSNANGVRKEKGDRGRTAYTIDMPQRIGYVGGKAGARQNNPPTRRMKLIVEGERVITAYPTWPPRR